MSGHHKGSRQIHALQITTPRRCKSHFRRGCTRSCDSSDKDAPGCNGCGRRVPCCIRHNHRHRRMSRKVPRLAGNCCRALMHSSGRSRYNQFAGHNFLLNDKDLRSRQACTGVEIGRQLLLKTDMSQTSLRRSPSPARSSGSFSSRSHFHSSGRDGCLQRTHYRTECSFAEDHCYCQCATRIEAGIWNSAMDNQNRKSLTIRQCAGRLKNELRNFVGFHRLYRD